MAEIKTKILLVFTVVAILSSLLRFGQRENNLSPLSDSDCYLDMAMVFSNQKTEFDQDLLRGLPHHYNRPFFPFLAGLLGHFILNNNFHAAFSVINILSAIFIAYLFFQIICKLYPNINHPWFPSLLFLTAFPQMDFGYHILTETIGLAFAFGSCYFLYGFILRHEKRQSDTEPAGTLTGNNYFFIGLGILFILQALSFLTRETGWFIFIFFAYMIAQRKLYKSSNLIMILIVLLVLLTAKLPQTLYARSFNTHIPEFSIVFAALFNPGYIIDTIFKLALAFSICWLLVIPAIINFKKNQLSKVHEFFIGWTLAALGYIAAGYIHNSLMPNGYPLRMLFSLFPIVYILVIEYIEKKSVYPKHNYILFLFLVLQTGISITGVLADSGVNIIHTINDTIKLLP